MWKPSLLICATLAAMIPARAVDTRALDGHLAQIAKWDYDETRESTRAVLDIIMKAQGSASELREIETRLDRFLDGNATLAGKDFVCKQLSLIGSGASVPVLSKMLLAGKTADMARYALERIPGAEADKALREALPKTSGKIQIGIINTLGQRHDPASVAALRPLASGTDAATAAPALFALAEIADPAALVVLSSAEAKASGKLKDAAADASLRAAERLFAGGQRSQAMDVARKLNAAGQPPLVRAGAFHLLAAAGGAEALSMAVEAMRGDDPRLQAMAIVYLAQHSPAQLVSEMPRLGEAAQIHALGELAEGANSSTLPAFTKAAEGTSAPVRVAALDGMAKVGNQSVVGLLAMFAVSGDQAEQTAARASLAAMPGKDVDRAVIDAIVGADPKLKVVLIRVAGQRGSPAAGPVLLRAARDSDIDVRHEALKALHDTASANEIGGLLALVTQPVQAEDRDDAVRSLAAILRRSDASHSHEVVAAYSPAGDNATRAALLQVMGQSGSSEAMPILRSALTDQNTDLRRAAILAISAWPDDGPIPDLLSVAKSDVTPAHQVLALRGVLRLVALPGSSRTAPEKVAVLGSVMSLAKQAEEKRAVLALLPRFPTRESLEIANNAIRDSDVSAEAKAAAARLERMVRR